MNMRKLTQLAMAAFLYLGVPTLALCNSKLQFTEVSSTVLTATLDGNRVGIVNYVGPDHWEWGSGWEGILIYNTNDIKASWQEPGGTGFNTLQFTDFGGPPLYLGWGFDILSDSASQLFGVAANGAYGFTFTISNSSGGIFFGPADVYFTDLEDNVVPGTHYVSLQSTNPTPPYTNWATAATNIQDAVILAATNDVVVVTNGVYPGGVTVATPLVLLSVNGPQFTVIDGGDFNQCIRLTDGASLTGFTVTNGHIRDDFLPGAGIACGSRKAFITNCVIQDNWAVYGGGVSYGTLYNCVLNGNRATERWIPGGPPGYPVLYPGEGAGAYYSTLYNCTLCSNSAVGGLGAGAFFCTLYNCTLRNNQALMSDVGGAGGGAYGGDLYNCTLTGNTAGAGGGVYNGAVYNSILFFNSAQTGTNYDTNATTLYYSCTEPPVPFPTRGAHNISLPPQFVDYANGNLRLQSNSSGINAGNNSYLTNSYFTNCFDLDGRPRIVGSRVDMGAYEFQPGISGAFIGWLQQYGLPTDGSADFVDSDGDGMNNWQEWICGTAPTNPQSALRMVSATPAPTNVTVAWKSVAGVTYFLQRSGDLRSPFTLLATNIIGQASTTSYTDTSPTGGGPFFYRVGVTPP
jgi:hypothetical protein